jgi:hypothetical protein
MTDRYALHLVTPATKVYVHVIQTEAQEQDVLRAQATAEPGTELHVPLRAPETLRARLRETLAFTIA